MIIRIIVGILGTTTLLFLGFLIGANLEYEEPICPACIQKITSCPTDPGCPELQCPVVVCNKTTNKELVDSMNNTYTIGLINQIQRCENEVLHYLESNTTVICSRVSERLEQCEQTLNQTKNLLND